MSSTSSGPAPPGHEGAGGEGGLLSRWLEPVFRYGFVTAFAMLAAVAGLYFGVQLLETQRQGIEAITRIEVTQEHQMLELREMNQRLELLSRQVQELGR